MLIQLYRKIKNYVINLNMRILFLLLFISSIPAIVVFIWFRYARYPFSVPKFIIFLLVGLTSFFPALFFQNILATSNIIYSLMEKWGPITEIFIRIAFTEELSRLIMLSLLFYAIHRFSPAAPQDTNPDTYTSTITMASAAGLVTGLGFAIMESAVYGASNLGNALLRAFTAAPLHGACGSRVGSSVALFRKYPVQAFFRFLFAVAIHGIYNFMLIVPGRLSPLIALLIALSAFASSVLAIRSGLTSEPDKT
jgi:RsiW-degrading membrane proteinase PrsW (M82 family)